MLDVYYTNQLVKVARTRERNVGRWMGNVEQGNIDIGTQADRQIDTRRKEVRIYVGNDSPPRPHSIAHQTLGKNRLGGGVD